MLTRGVVVVLFGTALAVGCGSRSGMLLPGGSSGVGGTEAGAGGTATGGGGSGGSGGGLIDAGSDVPPLPDCRFSPLAESHEAVTYGEGVRGPMLAVLEPGGGGSVARVALTAIHEHFWHPDIRTAEFTVSQQWPAGVVNTKPMTLFGIDAHGWGQLTPAAGNGDGLALAYYHGDEANPAVTPGLKFRPFDTKSWSPGAEVFVDPAGTLATSMARGPSVDAQGSYVDAGYLVAFRTVLAQGFSEPRIALVDRAGKVLRGPIAVVPPSDYPGGSAEVVWTGSEYVVGVDPANCKPALPCGDTEVQLYRFEPGAAGQTPQLVSMGSVAATPGYRVRRPQLASWQGVTWMLWRERLPDNTGPQALRLIQLSSGGQPIGAPVTLASGRPLTGPVLEVSDLGVTAVWNEERNPGLPDSTVGHSALVLHHRNLAGEVLEPPFELPTPAFSTGPSFAAASLRAPRALLLAFGAHTPSPGAPAVFLSRIDCLVPED